MPGQRREGDGGRIGILLARQSGGVWAEGWWVELTMCGLRSWGAGRRGSAVGRCLQALDSGGGPAERGQDGATMCAGKPQRLSQSAASEWLWAGSADR